MDAAETLIPATVRLISVLLESQAAKVRTKPQVSTQNLRQNWGKNSSNGIQQKNGQGTGVVIIKK